MASAAASSSHRGPRDYDYNDDNCDDHLSPPLLAIRIRHAGLSRRIPREDKRQGLR